MPNSHFPQSIAKLPGILRGGRDWLTNPFPLLQKISQQERMLTLLQEGVRELLQIM